MEELRHNLLDDGFVQRPHTDERRIEEIGVLVIPSPTTAISRGISYPASLIT